MIKRISKRDGGKVGVWLDNKTDYPFAVGDQVAYEAVVKSLGWPVTADNLSSVHRWANEVGNGRVAAIDIEA